jgi:hypothetical protein
MMIVEVDMDVEQEVPPLAELNYSNPGPHTAPFNSTDDVGVLDNTTGGSWTSSRFIRRLAKKGSRAWWLHSIGKFRTTRCWARCILRTISQALNNGFAIF